MIRVPYRGSSQALNDLLSGQIELNFDSPPPTLQFIKAGKLRALAITSEKRHRYYPKCRRCLRRGYPALNLRSGLAW
jgi:tripartite-type tricarboxylate transporter receptor subunit TctC